MGVFLTHGVYYLYTEEKKCLYRRKISVPNPLKGEIYGSNFSSDGVGLGCHLIRGREFDSVGLLPKNNSRQVVHTRQTVFIYFHWQA